MLFVSEAHDGKRENKGYCLPCALDLDISGARQALGQMGIDEDNVDELTQQMNQMMESFGGQDPSELFSQMMRQITPEQMQQIQRMIEKMQQSGADSPNAMIGFLPHVSDDADDADADDDDEEEAQAIPDFIEEPSPASDADDGTEDAPDREDKSARWPKPRFPFVKPDEDERSDEDEKESKDEQPRPNDAQSLGQAIQMMFGPFMSGEGGGAFMPAARGADSEERDVQEVDRRGDDGERGSEGQARRRRDRKRRFLDNFGTNLNQLARDGELDPMIGRERELDRVIQILNRRQKNNPVLLGEPGVGKTAIAQGLASRIVAEQVPYKLLPMEVYLIDMTGLVAGTQFRGQFESRMKGLVDEARKLGNIILVIDELHNIMGAGDAEGAMNAANILKPALARGELRVLGSTTLDEYRRFIEKDSALERRFQRVIVDEPDDELSLEILRGLAPHYAKHHHVSYSDEVLQETVRLASRYISDRYFPDKAIDIIDEAGSRVNLRDRYQQLRDELQREGESIAAEQTKLQKQIEQNPDDVALYEKQANVRTRMLQLEERIAENESQAQPLAVEIEDVAGVVELWTGIPLSRISESESDSLLKLEERLHERVIGQETAVSALARAMRRQRAGFGRRKRPASFIFVGPTGVGKTELVKALSEAIFASEDAMIRLDMSEYMEAHTVSKLIGSPPGYVGYGDGGQLTEKVRRRPYSVLLLDEIEKAHPDVFNMLLQILDDGRLTDSQGRTVNFENTILIMTSNAGTTLKGHTIGFGADNVVALESRVHQVLREMFRPEFLNRVDEIIVFHELSRDEIRRIVDLMVREVSTSLKEHGISLSLSDEAKDLLAERGYDPKFGARPLRKMIQRMIEDPLAEEALRGALEGKTLLAITVDEELDERGEKKLKFDFA